MSEDQRTTEDARAVNESATEAVSHLFRTGSFPGMRAMVFGTFYEEILREWFARSGSFEVLSGKPQVLWESVELPEDAPAGNLGRLVHAAQVKKATGRYALPDGLFVRDGRHYVWEAKNWITELWNEPFRQTVWSFAWLLATKVRHKGQDHDIDGFVVSWWDPLNKNEEGLELVRDEVRELIHPRTLDVVGTREILIQCMSEQPNWFRNIVESRQESLKQFFETLLRTNSF